MVSDMKAGNAFKCSDCGTRSKKREFKASLTAGVSNIIQNNNKKLLRNI